MAGKENGDVVGHDAHALNRDSSGASHYGERGEGQGFHIPILRRDVTRPHATARLTLTALIRRQTSQGSLLWSLLYTRPS